MTIFDVDRSGTIGYDEFVGLWKHVKDWRKFGYNLSPRLLDLVERKYGEFSSAASMTAHADDRFVGACVAVE
ncbi:uncharacterized protein B0H18DRAFT_1132107 [Fomitopsis serialis]|uniref:uncharacterized protein n=1 Tax=Fomitopsis serialis TaxID=139415 RepID=UPI00200841D7|nr:uncharacterized protein B0H18DRAFT_1132107 [Neoantrodia serialis]KAH9905534.1 hypothetical protein B0H18DRAFT_1132107 [Neoantrodia serialis]